MVPARYNRTAGALRLAAAYLLIAGVVAVARPSPLSVTLGFVIVSVGETLRVWAAGHLRKNVDLVTSGPFRYTRNPLYLGRLLIFSGLCVMALMPYHANYVVLAAGYIVFFGYYLPRKERVEPGRLLKIHGEAYARYFNAVPALFPTRTPFPEGASTGWSSERMRRNREHWMVIALLALSLFLLWIAYIRPAGLLSGLLDGW